VITRLTFGRLGTVALVALAVALPLGVWVLLESRSRYTRDAGIREGRPRGGVSSAALTVGLVAVAAVELAALLRGS
jgi:hypothetical protein